MKTNTANVILQKRRNSPWRIYMAYSHATGRAGLSQAEAQHEMEMTDRGPQYKVVKLNSVVFKKLSGAVDAYPVGCAP